jgi:hypothetical protein
MPASASAPASTAAMSAAAVLRERCRHQTGREQCGEKS